MAERTGRIKGQMYRWKDRRKDGRMEGWKDGRMEGRIDSSICRSKNSEKEKRREMNDIEN